MYQLSGFMGEDAGSCVLRPWFCMTNDNKVEAWHENGNSDQVRSQYDMPIHKAAVFCNLFQLYTHKYKYCPRIGLLGRVQ
jgi:hypothetical protein